MTVSAGGTLRGVFVPIVGGSLVGVVLRWTVGSVLGASVGQSTAATLVVSLPGGIGAGLLLGITLADRSTARTRMPLTLTLLAAIATFGASAVLEIPPEASASVPPRQDTVVNVGAAILAAGAGTALALRWRRPR